MARQRTASPTLRRVAVNVVQDEEEADEEEDVDVDEDEYTELDIER